MLNDLKQNSLPSHSRVPPVGVWSLRKYPGMSRIPRHSSAPPTAVRKKLLMAPHLLQGLCHSSNCIPKEWGYHIPEERAGYTQQLPRAGNNTGGTRAQKRNIPVDMQGSLLQGSLQPSPSVFRFLGEGTHFLWRLQDKNVPQKKKKKKSQNHRMVLGWKAAPGSSHSKGCAMGRDTFPYHRLLQVLCNLAWKRPKR